MAAGAKIADVAGTVARECRAPGGRIVPGDVVGYLGIVFPGHCGPGHDSERRRREATRLHAEGRRRAGWRGRGRWGDTRRVAAAAAGPHGKPKNQAANQTRNRSHPTSSSIYNKVGSRRERSTSGRATNVN